MGAFVFFSLFATNTKWGILEVFYSSFFLHADSKPVPGWKRLWKPNSELCVLLKGINKITDSSSLRGRRADTICLLPWWLFDELEWISELQFNTFFLAFSSHVLMRSGATPDVPKDNRDAEWTKRQGTFCNWVFMPQKHRQVGAETTLKLIDR